MASPPSDASVYRVLVESAADGMWSVDTAFIITAINPVFQAAFAALYGVQLERGANILEAATGDDSDRWRRRYERALEGTQIVERDVYTVGGKTYHLEFTLTPILNPDEIPSGVAVVARDITESHAILEMQADNAQRFELLLDFAALLAGEITDIEAVYRTTLEFLHRGVPFDTASVQVLDEGMVRIVACAGFEDPDTVNGLEFPLEDRFPNYYVVKNRRHVSLPDAVVEYPHFQSAAGEFTSGHIRSWLGVPLIARDTVVGMIAIDRSSVNPFSETEIALSNGFAAHVAAAIRNAHLYRELETANQTKEVILRELHHRVKNNMQLISSLLSLRGQGMANEEASNALKELRLKVVALAEVHEHLYESSVIGQIDVGEYTRRIVDTVVTGYATRPGDVRSNVETGGFLIGLETSVPHGIILSELVLNSVKYGSNANGEIHVTVRVSHRGGMMIVEVFDTGGGLPPEVDLEHPHSFGLMMIRSLVEQLDGELSYTYRAGAHWRISFPLKPPSNNVTAVG